MKETPTEPVDEDVEELNLDEELLKRSCHRLETDKATGAVYFVNADGCRQKLSLQERLFLRAGILTINQLAAKYSNQPCQAGW